MRFKLLLTYLMLLLVHHSFYIADMRVKIKKENPDMDFAAVSKECGT